MTIGGLGISEIIPIILLISIFFVIYLIGKRFSKKQTDFPEKKHKGTHTIIALIAIIGYFMIDSTPNIFYGHYGAIVFGVLCAIIASTKYRNPVTWFAFGLWFVLASLIVLLFFPKLHLRLCPFCREGVAIDATACPHCQRDIEVSVREESI